jgi:probable F420-dependent oxidoreductase
MKYCTTLYPYASFTGGIPDMVAFTERADALGFHSVLIPDHSIFPVEQERLMGQPWHDALIMAGHLAAKTSRIRLAFGVLVLPQRNPVQLARQLATLDEISAGRIDAGFGVGWLKEEFDALGEDFHTRGARMDEYLRLMKTLWTTHPSSFQGRWFSFTDASFQPKPIQQPHPPIIIGGTWRHSAKRAAEFGDGWWPLDIPDAELDDAMALLDRELARVGRTKANFAIFGHLPLFPHTPEAREHAEEAGAAVMGDLNGDPGRTREYIARAEQRGYTHLWVELPADRQTAELERFAREFMS